MSRRTKVELEFDLGLKDGIIEGLKKRLGQKDVYIKLLERKLSDKLPLARRGVSAARGHQKALENKRARRDYLVDSFILYRKDCGLSLSDARKKANTDVLDEYGKGYGERTLYKLTDELIKERRKEN